MLTAVVLVLPLALAAPGGANDVNQLRSAVEDALRAGLPGAPHWVFQIPLVGPSFGDLWNRWAADISEMVDAMRPYFGIALEGGLTLLLGIDRFMSQIRSLTNLVGNGVATVVVAKWENEFDPAREDETVEPMKVVV